MIPLSMRKALIALALVPIPLFSQSPSTRPTLQQIISNLAAMNAARSAALHSYRSTRTYQVTYKGFPSGATAKAIVQLEYTAPDKKKFTIVSQEGSKLLVSRVIRKALESEEEAAQPAMQKRSAVTEENYKFELLGMDAVAGRPCFLIKVTPRRDDKYLYDGRICVDSADFAVARVEAKPARNPSFWISRAQIEHRNAKVNDFWLPASNRSTSHVRLGGEAVLAIDYGQYQITGASPVSTLRH
jgi:MucB/RseB N-terminal domain